MALDTPSPLRGRIALITGATGHLGREMTFALARAGAHVLVNSRSLTRVDALVSAVSSVGLSAESAAFDARSARGVADFVSELGQKSIHILINNAYAGGAGSIELARPVDYKDSYDIALVSTHRLLRSLLPNLRGAVKECGDASVINIASMYALVSPDQRIYNAPGSVNPPFYGAAKAALVQWTKYAACEFGKEGIRVNCISPGPFPSAAVQGDNPGFVGRLENRVPLGRVGRADEIGGPVLFLASGASSYVTGANIIVDGGWTCW